jgi:ankyrin repeat protein
MLKIIDHYIHLSLVIIILLNYYTHHYSSWLNIGGNIEAVEICLRNGGSIDDQQDDLSTPVHVASSQGSIELLNLMFTCQPELKTKVIRMTDVQGMTPLHK